MWSKGAQKDYLDVYEDCDEEYDDYYEEEKPEQKQVEPKSEIKPQVEVKVEVKPVEVKVEEKELVSEYSSEDDYDFTTTVCKPVVYERHNEELMFDNFDNFSYDNSMEFYKKYKESNSAGNIIKRFGFKKLKSNDNNTYYLDKTLYYIWKFVKNTKTGEDELIRVDDSQWETLKKHNQNTVIYDRYLPQPIICY